VLAPVPSLEIEHGFIVSGARLVAGLDEVGRGAIAGPVMVGVVCVGPAHATVPEGLRDSKLMTPKRREAMVATVHEWAHSHAVGAASAAEVDLLGIMGALSLAASRAVAGLPELPDVLICDGTTPFLLAERGATGNDCPEVVARVRADQQCASVAAASVIAKVRRDALMVELHGTHPHYGWDSNKGYGAAVHTAAIREHGLCDLHRRSWNIA